MPDLFIPPPGALQFEVLQGWDGTPTPEKYRPFVMWVMPPVVYGRKESKPDCPHAKSYPVIHASLSPILRKGIGSCQQVCGCVGRIIE